MRWRWQRVDADAVEKRSDRDRRYLTNNTARNEPAKMLASGHGKSNDGSRIQITGRTNGARKSAGPRVTPTIGASGVKPIPPTRNATVANKSSAMPDDKSRPPIEIPPATKP
jgi:hypothetical protein